ncbi:MAG: serine/threonine protein kinase [Myxococcales bacterium]|nr:serine/threonine protein kinase [Myxococcales bacterium]
MSNAGQGVDRVLEGTSLRLIASLGRGATGELYRAEHVKLKKRVLVKVTDRTRADAPELAERMRLEAQALARLVHANLVEVIDTGISAGRPYVVMEDDGGWTLADILARQQRIVPRDAVPLACDVLDGLAFIHASGLVHRNIQPQSVLVCPRPGGREIARIIDFGMVKVLGGHDQHHLAPLAMHTAVGTAIGTPRYAAPEQAMGEAVEPRTDLYGVGAMLYHMLAGRDPFAHHASLPALIAAQLREVPRPPSTETPGLGAALDRVVLRALAKKPAERFATAKEMREALMAAVAQDDRGQEDHPFAATVALAVDQGERAREETRKAANNVAPVRTAPMRIAAPAQAPVETTAPLPTPAPMLAPMPAPTPAEWKAPDHGPEVPPDPSTERLDVMGVPRREPARPVVVLAVTSLVSLVVTLLALIGMQRCHADTPRGTEQGAVHGGRLSTR